jgi:NTP pyrophosphatase (non-canonical NTP hydrolase)
MNKVEHLLTCLVEECAEVQQAVTKALRFGLDDDFKETTPKQDIIRECIEVIAVIKLLEEEGIIELTGVITAIEQKKAKIRHYMEYAKERGTLISS